MNNIVRQFECFIKKCDSFF